jgi:threonine aldolase
MIVGTKELIDESRRWRKILGGGMRQAGVIAAAGLYALDNNIERLSEDHENARRLAEALAECPWAEVDPDTVETNIIFIKTPGRDAGEIELRLGAEGVRVIATAEDEIRLVTSLEVGRKEIEDACGVFRNLLA